MATVDALPADQKAVVQLLLRQGKSYEEISGLLRISPEAVRARAHEALAALGPQEAGLTLARRGELADFLLGQQDDQQTAATRTFLAGSASGRAWARVVSGELRPIGGDALPAVPEAGDAPEPGPAPVDGPGHPVPDLAAESSTPIPGPRSSRVGGMLLLGGAALVIAVVLVIVLVVSGGGGGKKKVAAKTPARTTTTSTTPATVIGQANLVPPSGRGNGKTLGVVQIVRQQGQLRIRAVAQGLPTPPKNSGYGVWFVAGSNAQWLGYFQVFTKQGQAVAEGGLPVDPTKYKTVLITAEKGKNPPRPSRAVLSGPIQLKSGG
jgi:hypothetical protein